MSIVSSHLTYEPGVSTPWLPFSSPSPPLRFDLALVAHVRLGDKNLGRPGRVWLQEPQSVLGPGQPPSVYSRQLVADVFPLLGSSL